MTVTYDINPDAVWDDGSPITVDDFQCTLDAILNTPGSIEHGGLRPDHVVEQGDADHQVVVKFSEVYAPYKNLFGSGQFIKAAAVANCKDVSADFADNIPFSAVPVQDATRGARTKSSSSRTTSTGDRQGQGRQGRHGPEGRQRHRDRLAGRG